MYFYEPFEADLYIDIDFTHPGQCNTQRSSFAGCYEDVEATGSSAVTYQHGFKGVFWPHLDV